MAWRIKVQQQAIGRTNADVGIVIWDLRNKRQWNSHLEMLSAKWQPFCLNINDWDRDDAVTSGC